MTMNNNTAEMIKTITFDLDDTLWDVEPVLIQAEQTTYAWLTEHAPLLTQHYTQAALSEQKFGVYNNRPELAHQISQLRIVAMQEALIEARYPPQLAQQLSQQAFAIFIEARHQVSLYEEVEPLLSTLKPHYKLGVLTNGNANVERLTIGHYFDFTVSAEQLNASKPAKDHFIAAQQASGNAAEQILHVGDHPVQDILAARAAGCHAIWFNPNHNPWPETEPMGGAIHSLADLPKAIHDIEITK